MGFVAKQRGKKMPEYIVLSTVPMESLEELIRCKDCKHQRKEKHPRTGGWIIGLIGAIWMPKD